MKRACFVGLFLGLTTSFLWPQSNPVPFIHQTARTVSPVSASQPEPKAQARILNSYGKRPLSFEANQGQADARVKFLSRASGYTLFLAGDEAVLMLRGKAKNRRANAVGHVAKSSAQGLRPASPAASSGEAEQAAEKLRFVSGHRFSDAASFGKSKAPLGASHRGLPAAEPATGAVLRMKLRHANPVAKVTGADELAGTSNYFIGNDPAKWRTNVPTYAKVKYEGIYPGIDLVYYGNQRQLEYDFIVAPGADPRRIQFDVGGARRVRRDEHGDLILKMSEGEIRWHKPVVYQEKDGARKVVAAHYAITEKNRVGFEVAEYDASRPLYIDPLIYSTYLGGSGSDGGNGISVDSAGNAYITGGTNSTDFPTTTGAFQAVCNGGSNCATYGDVFVAKINPTGSALVYSTYLGGSGDDFGASIAVDSSGNAYVTGTTYSTDFPTMNPLQPANGGNRDAFVAKLNPSGSALVYSTYLGGSNTDFGQAIALDSANNAYVAGDTGSTDFPTTSGVVQTNLGYPWDAFVSKINPEGSALVYSTYLGGSGSDEGTGIAVDSAGNAYVTGATYSADFPMKNPLQPANGGNGDAFVAELNLTGSSLVYSTYLGGGRYDGGLGIAVDSAGSAHVTGYTYSYDFPTMNALQPANGGSPDAFVAKFNPEGSALVYSTYLGGNKGDFGYGIAVDSSGNAYVTGGTYSVYFPTENPLQKHYGGGDGDAFVSKLNPAGSALLYSTFLGGSGRDWGYGIAVDRSINAHVTGSTDSTDFPTKNPLQAANDGGGDAFVTEIQMLAATSTTLTSALNPSTYGQAVTFTAVVTSVPGAPPDGEVVTFMKGKKVLGTGALSGGSASFTTSTLKVGTTVVKAVYEGDSNFAGSTSNAVTQVVSKATTMTTLVSSQNPSNFGQSVTFTASVTPQFSGTVKGSVTFYDGTALKTVSLSGGAAKFTTSALARGTHSMTATYNGSTSFAGSSASLTQTVN